MDLTRLKNKRLEVAYTKTVNLGNYESLKLHAALSVDVLDSEDLGKVYEELFIYLEDIVGKEEEELVK